MSLASFKPRPHASLTALTTCNFAAPALFKTTSKDVFSSAAAAPAAAGPAATATAAAAGSIPYSNIISSVVGTHTATQARPPVGRF